MRFWKSSKAPKNNEIEIRNSAKKEIEYRERVMELLSRSWSKSSEWLAMRVSLKTPSGLETEGFGNKKLKTIKSVNRRLN